MNAIPMTAQSMQRKAIIHPVSRRRFNGDAVKYRMGVLAVTSSVILCIIVLLAALPAVAQQEQVNVSVKIVEFQTISGVETGFSAYYRQREIPQPYGRASTGQGAISEADLTFPTRSSSGITVFLDRLSGRHGDYEVVLQGLVSKNRAFILSRPKAMVVVGQPTPTVIQTVQQVPYVNKVVVGSTAVQTTSFRNTGVSLSVMAEQIADDDGDFTTNDDTYIKLNLTAEVNEEGQRINVAVEDSEGLLGQRSSISVPEFVTRNITTSVWVRHGEVLVLGGLYRNTKNKDLSTLPWLTQGSDIVQGAFQRMTPFMTPSIPITAGLGGQHTSEGRRELVFLIKAERWRPAFTVAGDFGFDEEEDDGRRTRPSDVITGVIEGITDISEGLGGLSGGDVSSSLGGEIR